MAILRLVIVASLTECYPLAQTNVRCKRFGSLSGKLKRKHGLTDTDRSECARRFKLELNEFFFSLFVRILPASQVPKIIYKSNKENTIQKVEISESFEDFYPQQDGNKYYL